MEAMHTNESDMNKRSVTDRFSELTNSTEQREASDLTFETYSFFKDMLEQNGYEEYDNMGDAYSQLPAEQLIVRREDPRKIMELFSENQSYEIGFQSDRYSNCVEWNPQTDGSKNIHNAYMEGFTNLNHIVVTIGFEKRDGDDLMAMEDATQDFYGLDRRGVRSFKGSVSQDRVAFINLRIPGHLLPESELNDDEIDRVDAYLDAIDNEEEASPVMIHRAYVPSAHEEHEAEAIKKAA